jgi:polar amino acid transport system permease protein
VAGLVRGVVVYLLSPNFLAGALVTLALSLVAESAGILLGFIIALAKTARWTPLKRMADAYIFLFRGTPVLLQLIFVYDALPQFGIRLSSFESAATALLLNEAAYMSEIIRAGIEAISQGQRVAARALGMKEWQVMRYVVLPQAARIIIPPTGNQFIGMLKTSALASVIAVQDLLLSAQRVASANFDYVNTLVAAAIYYLALTTIFTVGQGYVEKRMQRVGRARGEARLTPVPVRPFSEPRRPAEPPSVPVLQIENLSKIYHGHRILDSISLTVRQGESLVVIGPSGAGKSTLLRCIAGLEHVDDGRIVFLGADLRSAGRGLHRVRADIGMVFQSFNLFPHMTALENVMLAPMKVRGLSRPAAEERAVALLARVGLTDKIASAPEELSGGQQQRVAIARALAMGPKLMLFDEPTSALDPEMTREVLDAMVELVEDGMTVIVVTHEMGFARRAADRVVFMDAGRVVEDAPVERIFTAATHPRTQQFLKQIIAY